MENYMDIRLINHRILNRLRRIHLNINILNLMDIIIVNIIKH